MKFSISILEEKETDCSYFGFGSFDLDSFMLTLKRDLPAFFLTDPSF